MATKVHMEALSPTMEEGQLVRWLKGEGDEVAEGDVLAEIETDKATMELVARGSGVLRRIGLGEGETAPVGQVIGVIAGADEDIAGLVAEFGGNGGKPPASTAPRSESEGEAAATAVADEPDEGEADETKAEEAEGGEAKGAARKGSGSAQARPDGRIKASPLAKRLASEAGIELAAVEGSGPGGRIVKRDIEAAAKAPAAPAKVAARRIAAEVEEAEEVPLSQMRKTIAKRLALSIGPIPTFYLTTDIDMTRMLSARESANAQLEKDGVKASINDFLIKALAVALSRHPEVNAEWGDKAITRHHRVHIGVAVAIDDGLITPVVRDADGKGVAEIAVEVKELATRAREKKLKPDEYTGATFSISNLGMFGIDEFTAIINPPESGILAVGQVTERVVVENGEMVVRPRMRMTMSCDHRVVDGATGARFLQTLRKFIEEPVMMVI
ncbi:MAG: pyruvate dehydrogenase complex dihydrolipoamide acetyltransferase [Longimicrobiales bacterium]